MRLRRSDNTEPPTQRRKKPSITAQPLFVPLMTAWGAALAGLSVAVLPDSTIAQMMSIAALGVLGSFARLFFAVIAAGLGAAALYAVATRWRVSLPSAPKAVEAATGQRFKAINPAADLGSESLDAPIEDEISADAVAGDDAWVEDTEAKEDDAAPQPVVPGPAMNDDDTLELSLEAICEAEEDAVPDAGLEETADPEPSPRPAPDPEPAENGENWASRRLKGRKENRRTELVHALTDHMARKAAEAKAAAPEVQQPERSKTADDLDLGKYAQLPPERQAGRSLLSGRHLPSEGTAADRLRAVPPEDLSVVQLVERLAVALHEHQDIARSRPQTADATKRDAALAEALKTLSMFTEKGFDATAAAPANAEDGSNDELREALDKLGTMRGAA